MDEKEKKEKKEETQKNTENKKDIKKEEKNKKVDNKVKGKVTVEGKKSKKAPVITAIVIIIDVYKRQFMYHVKYVKEKDITEKH